MSARRGCSRVAFTLALQSTPWFLQNEKDLVSAAEALPGIEPGSREYCSPTMASQNPG